MADHVNNATEEIKDETSKNNQQYDSQTDKESVINEITQLLNHLFEPNNLSNNSYLINRSQGITFDIPVKYIYDEFTIKSKTSDPEIINEAIERAENVIANKKGDVIESVKPRYDQLRKNITVKGIVREDEGAFKQAIYALEKAQESITNWNSNQQLSLITIICKDEKSAIDLFNQISKTKFKDEIIDCQLNFENLYIIGLENIKSRNRGGSGYQQNRNFNMMNPYQMPNMFFNPMSNNYFKNFYPPNGFYMPNPMMAQMQMQMNPNINGPVNRPPNQYRGGKRGGGGGYRKPRGSRGGGGGRYHKNGRGGSGEQTRVEINESNFPPLSGDSPGSQ